MRFLRFLGRSFLELLPWAIVAIGLLFVFVPREPVDEEISFDGNTIGDDIDGYLATQEARFDDITPGVEKRIVWAGDKGAITNAVIVYLHGWSATSEEIRPVPDQVAKALGANLYFARLAGHGRTGEAFAEATASDWIEDVAEAMAVARKLGNHVIVMGTSTGGALASYIASNRELNPDLAAVVLISPNYKIKDPASMILTFPFARSVVPALVGNTRSWEGKNEAHNTYWTTSYHSTALVPMAALVKKVRGLDFEEIKTPALFIYSPDDQVVEAKRTEKVIEKWGGQTAIATRVMNEGDDENSHVIAGEIMSPSQTDEVVEIIVNWAKKL